MNLWRAEDGILIHLTFGSLDGNTQRIKATWDEAMDTYKMELKVQREKEEALRAEAEGKSLGL